MSNVLKAVGGYMQFVAVAQFLGYAIYFTFGNPVDTNSVVFAIGSVVAGAAISRAGKNLEKPAVAKKDELGPFPPGSMASS